MLPTKQSQGASAIQKARKILKLKERNGHTIFPPCLAWISLLDRKEDLRTRTYGQHGGPGRERGSVEHIPEYHSSSSSSFFLVKIMRWIHDSSRFIISGRLWNSYSKKLKKWSQSDRTSLVSPRLITKNLRWDRQACCATEFIRSQIPKPTSSPTRCSVWGKWEMILLRRGRARLNGLRENNHFKDVNRTACRRSSSGKYSLDSRRYAASRRFKNWWKTYSVNLSSSTTGSSSRQCTTTLHGEKKETQKGVMTIQRQLRIMFANSVAVIGLSWGLGSEKKWYGTHSCKPDGSSDKIAEQMMMDFSEHGHPIFRASQCLGKRWTQKQRRGKEVHSLQRLRMKTSSCFSGRYFVQISSVSTEQLQICAGNYPKILGLRWKLMHLNNWRRKSTESSVAPSYRRKATGKLVQDYERRFEQLSDDQKLSKLCSDACLKIVEIGQYFFMDQMMWNIFAENKHCLETKRRLERNGGFFDSIQDRYSIEILVESLFQDRTASCVRIVNGIDKYVTESMETKEEEVHRTSGRPVAKARARLKPAVALSSVSVARERKWIDINPENYRHDCFLVSKAMTWLLRHDQSVPLEDDGAVLFDDVLEEFCKKKSSMVICNVQLTNGKLCWRKEDEREWFQYCLNPDSSKHFLYFRALQGHSGGNAVARQCTVTKRIYWLHLPRRECSQKNSIIRSGLIPGGRSLKRGIHSVFFTFANPVGKW